MKLEPSTALSQAVQLAQERGLLPTDMSSTELQELTLRMRERVFFSARTTNLWYVERLKVLVERFVTGEGRDNDLAQLRIEARNLLARAGYVPERGFPGDESLGIPPAERGSLKDLSSEKRLNVIFKTQADMMRGLGLKLRGLGRVDRYPAWELVRVSNFSVQQPREWLRRWGIAFDNVDGVGVAKDVGLRMIALKTSPIWLALGSSSLFEDALNVDHPPFAFGSGMGWREVPLDECEEIGLVSATEKAIPGAADSKIGRIFANALGKQGADPELARTMRGLVKGMGMSSADAAKLARYEKLQAKFDAIDRAAPSRLSAPLKGGAGTPARNTNALKKASGVEDALTAQALTPKALMNYKQAENLIASLTEAKPVKVDNVIEALHLPEAHPVLTPSFIRGEVESFVSRLPADVAAKLPKLTVSTQFDLPGNIAGTNAEKEIILSEFALLKQSDASRVMQHEMTHWLHRALPADHPWVQAINQHFYNRTLGEEVGPLAWDANGNALYEGKRDQWFNHYMGRFYFVHEEATHQGLEWPTGCLELLSSPKDFADAWNSSQSARDDLALAMQIFFP